MQIYEGKKQFIVFDLLHLIIDNSRWQIGMYFPKKKLK